MAGLLRNATPPYVEEKKAYWNSVSVTPRALVSESPSSAISAITDIASPGGKQHEDVYSTLIASWSRPKKTLPPLSPTEIYDAKSIVAACVSLNSNGLILRQTWVFLDWDWEAARSWVGSMVNQLNRAHMWQSCITSYLRPVPHKEIVVQDLIFEGCATTKT